MIVLHIPLDVISRKQAYLLFRGNITLVYGSTDYITKHDIFNYRFLFPGTCGGPHVRTVVHRQ